MSDDEFTEKAARAIWLEERKAKVLEFSIINALSKVFGRGD